MLSSAFASLKERKVSKIKLWWMKRAHPQQNNSQQSYALPHTQNQSQLLIVIPLDIQREIYVCVVNSFGNHQHIIRIPNSKGKGKGKEADKQRRLTHMRCALPTSHTYFQHYFSKKLCLPHDSAYRMSVHNGWDIFALLLSCKKIYAEAIEILYLFTTFYSSYDHVATQFISAVPSRYIALTHLHLSYSLTNPMYLSTATNAEAEAKWGAFWQALTHVRVRTLIVEIIDAGETVPEERLLFQLMLKLMRSDNAPLKTEVVLPWPKDLETSAEFKNLSGLVIKRPPEEMGTELMVEWTFVRSCGLRTGWFKRQ